MRTKRVNRYYCDHCRKGSCGKASMVKHEQRCVRNPDRVCGFCRHAGHEQKPLPQLIESLSEDLKDIRTLAEDCPGCILAAIVQSGHQHPPDSEDPGFYYNFDFKAEVKTFWEDA